MIRVKATGKGVENINGTFIKVESEYGNYHLPMKIRGNKRRERILNQYASRLWRMPDAEKIKKVLNDLYELAYSNGIKDMDNVYVKTDKSMLNATKSY